jgi:hypothetical protein
MVLLGYFLIAAIVTVAGSAIVGLVLTNLLLGCFTKADRPVKSSCTSEINQELKPASVAVSAHRLIITVRETLLLTFQRRLNLHQENDTDGTRLQVSHDRNHHLGLP